MVMQLVPRWVLVSGFFLPCLTYAQPGLRLKNWTDGATSSAPITARGHHILQFDTPPSAETVAEVTLRGLVVLGDVPGNGLLVAASAEAELSPVALEDLGARSSGRFAWTQKISTEVADQSYLLVEFHKDVDTALVRNLVLNLGLELFENPDLNPHHLLIRNPEGLRKTQSIRRLAALDEVAYIFPASDDLIRGSYTVSCPGALTMNGSAGQIISSYGEGWDGPGKNAAVLDYVMGHMTLRLPAGTPQAEILRAMDEWSKVIQLTWRAGTNASGSRTVNIFFGAGAHGDSYPFDGPGKVLAHTFYPAPPNPEPIAGDMHLDEDETWRVGATIDLFSVVLHELGHALGLGHSDNPNDVMYPYYRIASTLAAGDKAAILALYAPAGSAPAPPPTPAPTPTPTPSNPLLLTVNTPVTPTSSTTLALSGTISGSSSPSITWSSTAGAFGAGRITGSNWTIPSVALSAGANTITVTASSGNTQVQRAVTVTRQTATVSADTTSPQMAIASPSTTSIGTSLASVTVSGSASDNVGVTRVLWVNNAGGSGTAEGTTAWKATC